MDICAVKIKRKTIFFAAALAVLLCVFGIFGTAQANGVVEEQNAPVSPDTKRSVRKAPVKRPAKPKKTVKKSNAKKAPKPQPPKLSSLERGLALMEQERYEQARPWLQKAVKEESGNPYAWYWYGVLHDKTGEYPEAQFFYTRAVELDPAFPPFLRVVAYPDEGDRKPLWDPLRPARVYPIETASRGIATVPPGSAQSAVRPERPPVDPRAPQSLVYTPPPPGEQVGPLYTPPSGERLGPSYTPPSPGSAIDSTEDK